MKSTKLEMPSFLLSQFLWSVGEWHFSKHRCASSTGPLLIWHFVNFLQGYISGCRSRASESSITGIAFSGFKSEHSYVTFTTIWLKMYQTTMKLYYVVLLLIVICYIKACSNVCDFLMKMHKFLMSLIALLLLWQHSSPGPLVLNTAAMLGDEIRFYNIW